MTIFGKRLEKLVKTLGKEYQEVAKDIGITKSQMSHFITGRNRVPSEILQKIVDIYKINPEFLFKDDVPLYLKPYEIIKEPLDDYQNPDHTTYPYYPTDISAGILTDIEAITKKDMQYISIPNAIMGRWAKLEDLFFCRINGDSMNRIIPHNSLIGVKPVPLPSLKDNDIVVFSNGVEFSVKRFFNDRINQRFIFRPDSDNNCFVDYTVKYEDLETIKIHGKVVVYIAELD